MRKKVKIASNKCSLLTGNVCREWEKKLYSLSTVGSWVLQSLCWICEHVAGALAGIKLTKNFDPMSIMSRHPHSAWRSQPHQPRRPLSTNGQRVMWYSLIMQKSSRSVCSLLLESPLTSYILHLWEIGQKTSRMGINYNGTPIWVASITQKISILATTIPRNVTMNVIHVMVVIQMLIAAWCEKSREDTRSTYVVHYTTVWYYLILRGIVAKKVGYDCFKPMLLAFHATYHDFDGYGASKTDGNN